MLKVPTKEIPRLIRIFLVFLLIVGSIDTYAQNLNEAISKSQELYKEKLYKEAIDLLQIAIKNDNGEVPSIVVDAKLWLARNYMHSWNTALAKKEYSEAWEMSKNLENDSLQIESGMSLAVIIGYEEKSDSVKILINELLAYDSLKREYKSNLYILLAGLHEDKEQLDSAIYYGNLAASIDSIYQDSSSIPYTFYDLGIFYVKNYEYKKGISKILYGLDYIRGKKDEYKKNTIELGLSNIYLNIGNVIKAKELANKSLNSAIKLGSQVNQTNAYYTLGNCEAFMDQHQKALEFYMKSDSVNQSKAKNFWRGIRAKSAIIDQKMSLKQTILPSDVEYINSINTETANNITKYQILFLKLRLSDYYQNNFDVAYNQLYKESKAENNLRFRKKLLSIRKEYLISKKRFEEAISTSNEINQIRKEITLTNNEYIIQDLEAKHRKKEQELTIQYLNKQNKSKDIKVKEQKSKIIIGSIALGLITLLSFFLFQLYQKIRSQKEIIAKSLNEKDLLLREIHHRVKNNLQLVSSLLTMQGRSIDDENTIQAINEGKSRVRSMALIHQDLYNRENLTGISVKDYIEKLARELFYTYKISDHRIKLELNIDNIELDIDTVVPLGLIINELITNSFKYAWPNENEGTLKITLKEYNGLTTLSVKDDGIGYVPQNVREESFGATLIAALTLQLEGKSNVQIDNGTETIITFRNDNL